MKTLSQLGRFIYAIPILVFGIFHFMNAPAMANKLPGGWPIAEGFVYISGLALILAAVAIVINKKAKLACVLLALLLLIIILVVHIPHNPGDNPEVMANMLRDIGLLGASLSYSGILKK